MRAFVSFLLVLLGVGGGLGLVGCGCGTSNNTIAKKRPSEPTNSDWLMKLPIRDDVSDTPALLTNGDMGIRLVSGFHKNPEIDSGYFRRGSIFFADRYKSGGEEKILAFGNPYAPYGDWYSNEFSTNGLVVRTWMDFDSGTLHSEYENFNSKIQVRSFIDPFRPVIATEMTIARAKKGNYAFSHNPLFGNSFSDPDTLKEVKKQFGTESPDSINHTYRIAIDGIGSSTDEPLGFDLESEQPLKVEFTSSFDGSEAPKLSEVRTRADSYWKDFWKTDILIDGPSEDQQAIRSLLFYLRSGIPPNASTPVSPLGLSSSTYNGHVFWDADIWIFPALALLDPERAKTISNYRIKMAKAAEKNFEEKRSWFKPETIPDGIEGVDGLQYPWESSVSGLEVSPTETKQQHHITGDVLWALGMASDLGIADPKVVNQIGEKAANFYLWRAEQVPSTDPKIEGLRTIKNTISPDEFHFGEDDLYTNCIAESVVRRFSKDYPDIEFLRPRDEKGFVNYSGDRLKGYKQAAGVLAIYPLQDPEVEPEARHMMDRFANKVTKNGPAMTDSVHALIWARLGEKVKAYETWRKSWKEFTNNPLLLFSEKRKKDVTYFSTGAAGCLQTVLYGFCGIRIDTKVQPGAKWQTPLKNGKVLSIKPNLPKEWKSVRLKGLMVLGKWHDLIIKGDSVKVVSSFATGR